MAQQVKLLASKTDNPVSNPWPCAFKGENWTPLTCSQASTHSPWHTCMQAHTHVHTHTHCKLKNKMCFFKHKKRLRVNVVVTKGKNIDDEMIKPGCDDMTNTGLRN